MPDDFADDDYSFEADEEAIESDELIDAADLKDEDIDVKKRLFTALARVRNILLACADALDLASEVVDEMET